METENDPLREMRIDDLETKVAYQERTIAELNALAFEQGKKLDRLESTLRQVVERLRETGDSGERQDVRERPPHY